MKYLVTLPALATTLLLLYCLQVSKAVAASYPVDTVLADTVVRTSVDSRHAQQLLQQPHLRSMYDPYLDPEDCQSDDKLPQAAVFTRITQDFSTDTATALLIDCLYRSPNVHHPQKLFHQAVNARRQNSAQLTDYLQARAEDYIVLFVPGWGYLSNGEVTGGNLRQPKALIAALGFQTVLVDLHDFGSVEANARIIADTLAHYLDQGKRLLLASASSGGPAVAAALQDPALFNHPDIAGWVNICGVLHGSPTIDRFSGFPGALVLHVLNLFEGWTYDELMSLTRRASTRRFAEFKAPPNLTILNYVGVPFSGQVSEMGGMLYGLLRNLGPNDGLTLIPEALAPGFTILAIGTDHFIRQDPEIDIKTAALLPVLLQLIETSP